MGKKIIIILLFVIAMIAIKPQVDFHKNMKYGVPAVLGHELGSVEVIIHNYLWY
jgi:hypothetical protein